MKELSGRVALVTGAASGIGAAIVARFQAEGARVAGLDVNPGAASDHNLIADLRSAAAIEKAVAATTAKLGAPDIVVHAAAASFPGGVFETDPATFLDLYDVNVVGAVRLLQLCVPAMRSRGGSVILFSSINADFATPTPGCLCRDQGGAEQSGADGRARARTGQHQDQRDRTGQHRHSAAARVICAHCRSRAGASRNIARHPLGRLGSAEEVAELALFLASDRARWITGSIYPIDGGAGVTRR